MLTTDSFRHPAAQRAAPGPYDVPDFQEVPQGARVVIECVRKATSGWARDIRRDGTAAARSDGKHGRVRDGVRAPGRDEARSVPVPEHDEARSAPVPERDEARSAPVPHRAPAGVAS
ncbi:hypothetical protein GCM10015535_15680 [Streptomyces gelaticus]|uniref:Uncharacterized protein n=1 Tax=Streptomyces gelaticus TaxID=285446 RepID=A0ABQ2VWL9_9ACTN|nr:hypothetical protein GCM10015535_15680 [Streptomyces gelaticus]